jgi:hypothetical protein
MAHADRCTARRRLRQAPRGRSNLPNRQPLRHGYPNGRPVRHCTVRDGPSTIIGRVSIAVAGPEHAIAYPDGRRHLVGDLE